MAGQSIERREILRILAMAAGVATFPGFSKWAFACSHIGNALAQIKPAVYRPVFFSATEYALVERLTDLIIPADDTPGAQDAGVSEFVDLMVSRDRELQRDFRAGLRWLNMRSHETWDKAFVMLNADQQTAFLESLAYRKKFRPGDESGQKFFDVVREYTVMGFYTSEIGLKELDYSGLSFYSESPSWRVNHLPPCFSASFVVHKRRSGRSTAIFSERISGWVDLKVSPRQASVGRHPEITRVASRSCSTSA